MNGRNMISDLKDRWHSLSLRGADIFAAFCTSFIISSLVFAFGGDFQNLSYVRQYPFALSVVICVLGFFIIIGASLAMNTKRLIPVSLLAFALVFSVVLVSARSGDVFFNLGVSVVLVLCAKYATDDDRAGFSKINLSRRGSLAIVWVMIAVFTLAVFYFTALKYKSFYHSTFDFGIFCQMFESMATTGLPTTTIERSRELSHFAVHFSPFFYLLLPGYFIFRSPLYLLFAQAFAVALGALAVRRICRALGLSDSTGVLAAAIYLLFPTMANGCFYDFHENKFLSVLILWLVAFILERKTVPVCVFALLVLSVKEDAFIYVIAICLWMFITKRQRKLAVGIFAFSLFWFFFACNMIELCGGEIMSGRFDNFSLSGKSSLWDTVVTCFTDIGYLIKEVFSGADTRAFREMTYSGQKLEFVLWTFAPLCFTPFLRKRPSEMVLLLPLLVINLMPSWMYQYDIDFQYTYGTCALIIFLFILFLREAKINVRAFVLCAGIMMCTVFALSASYPKAVNYYEKYTADREMYQKTEEALSAVDKEASVTAYGYIVPHLWYIEDLRSCPEYNEPYKKTDYYIIDTRYEKDSHTPEMYRAMGDSYELCLQEGYVKIFKLKEK